MNEIDIENYAVNYGATKYVSKPDDDGFIFKSFKKNGLHKPYSFEEQRNIIEKKKQYIGKFMPETELIKNDDGTYCIKQKYIEGKLLNSIDINQLDEQALSDLLELYDGCVAYCKNEGTQIDIMGYQEDIYNVENIRKRRFLHYSRLFNNFFSSTNIIISNDNKVYMIDVCDTVPVQKNSQKLHRIKKAVKQAIVKLGIKKAEFKIRHIIKGKREELLDAIS